MPELEISLAHWLSNTINGIRRNEKNVHRHSCPKRICSRPGWPFDSGIRTCLVFRRSLSSVRTLWV